MAEIQRVLDEAFAEMQANEFGPQRYAFLFLPGVYELAVHVGFSTQIAGLGFLPGDVVIRGGVQADGAWDRGKVTRNFWRVVENLSVEPRAGTNRWAVSQAAPFRRVHLRGHLVLDDAGWASGGFLADCVVDGTIDSGTQQQWFSRNARIGGWKGSSWNMVFAGVEGAPSQDDWPEPPFTSLDATPVIREKPFLTAVDGNWGVFVPALRSQTSGPSWFPGPASGTTIPLDRFHIAREGVDTAATLNQALAGGKHLLFTPGFYPLDATLEVTWPGTIVLGLGLATLVPQNGVKALTVADVDGVTIAGLLFDAGPVESAVLVEVGTPGCSADHGAHPTVLHDLFFRIGGATLGRAKVSLAVHSRHVIGDHFWLWRADHGRPATVGWDLNTAATGLMVSGDEVTIYGLFAEHYQEHQVLWSGNRGRVVFYQSEIPYDPPDQASYHSGTNGWASYKVADTVTDHQAWGLGVYCFFRVNPEVKLFHAFEVPEGPGIRFEHLTTVSLGGGVGEISHLINGRGEAVQKGHILARRKAL